MPSIQLVVLQYCWKQNIRNTWFARGFFLVTRVIHFLSPKFTTLNCPFAWCLDVGSDNWRQQTILSFSFSKIENNHCERVGRKGKPGRNISVRTDDTWPADVLEVNVSNTPQTFIPLGKMSSLRILVERHILQSASIIPFITQQHNALMFVSSLKVTFLKGRECAFTYLPFAEQGA